MHFLRTGFDHRSCQRLPIHVNVVQTFSGAGLPIPAALETRSTRLTSSFLSHELACVAIQHTYMVLCGLPCGLLGPVRRVSLMCSKFCWYSLIVFTCSAKVGTSCDNVIVALRPWPRDGNFTKVVPCDCCSCAVHSSWQLTCMSFCSRTPWTKKTWLVSKNCRRSLTVTIWQWPTPGINGYHLGMIWEYVYVIFVIYL